MGAGVGVHVGTGVQVGAGVGSVVGVQVATGIMVGVGIGVAVPSVIDGGAGVGVVTIGSVQASTTARAAVKLMPKAIAYALARREYAESSPIGLRLAPRPVTCCSLRWFVQHLTE